MATNSIADKPSEEPEINELIERLSTDRFRSWYRERQRRDNIRQGKPYYNGPPAVPEPEQHSPSQLLQCHRKLRYRKENTPAEQSSPQGVFWFGTHFEEDLILAFYETAVTRECEYVTNSIWVDYTVDTAEGELRIRGETDPVIVTAEGKPVLLTEIKTKESIENIQEPNPHHEAQVHAYLKGLSEKYDCSMSEAVLIYGSRKTLDIKSFHVEYDPYFWRNSVVAWAENHTSYRVSDELPPADPEYSWECQFCEYRERCGRGEKEHSDTGTTGFLPLYSDYPRKNVVEYLIAHSDDDAKLTPTLAQTYPELADEYGVYDWRCPDCAHHFGWNEVEWSRHTSKPPVCPECESEGQTSWLRGPSTDKQLNNHDPTDG